MALLTIQALRLRNWTNAETTPKLRLRASKEFIAKDNSGNPVIVAGPDFYQEWPLTTGTDANGKYVDIPAITVYSTADAVGGTLATLTFEFFDSLGNFIGAYRGFTRITLPESFVGSTTTTWDAVYIYNRPSSPILIDRETLNRDQILSLLSANSVKSFNTRNGVVTLTSADVLAALGFTPENAALAHVNTFNGRSGTVVPALNDYTFAQIGSKPTTVAGYGITDNLVNSFNSRTGAVAPVTNDYTWAQINKAVSDIADITTKAHASLTGIGTNTHAQVDTHIASTGNPHSVTKTQVGLGSVTNDAQLKIASNLSDLNNAASARTNLGLGTAALVNTGTGAGNVPVLDGAGKLVNSVIPDLAIAQYLGQTVSQAAMLALTGQRGDWTIRTDVGDEFILTTDDPTQAANWVQIVKPYSAVTSVFGRTGAIAAQSNDYTWAQVNKATSSLADITTRSAGDLSSGTLLDARLSSNVPLKNTNNDFTGNNSFNGYGYLSKFTDGVSGEIALQVGTGLNLRDANFQARRQWLGINNYAGAQPQGANYYMDSSIWSQYTGNPNTRDKWIGSYVYNSFQSLTASTSTTQDLYGVDAQTGVYDPGGSVYNFYGVFGGYFLAYHQAPGQITDGLIGVMGNSFAYGPGAVNKHRGVQGWAQIVSGNTGNTTASRGVYGLFSHSGSGTATEGSAGYFTINVNTGIITTASGVRVGNTAIAGSGTSKYGLYIEQQTVATPGNWTTVLNLYSAGDVPSVFEGFVSTKSISAGTTTDPGTGIINANTGFRIGNVAASGNVLRGNGTNFVSSAIQQGDFGTVMTPQFARIGLGAAADGTALIYGSGHINLSASSTQSWFAGFNAIQLGGNNSILSHAARQAASSFNLLHNAYLDAAGVLKYVSTDEASRYYQFNGEHQFDVATSGTAGTTVTFLTPWKIANSGHLLSPTDNTYDIGAAGATRPRNLYIAGTGTFGGAITPSQTAGIVGTTTNNDANAGAIGEYISSTVVEGSAISLTTSVTANVTSISLTAGDWDVSGTVAFKFGATTSYTLLAAGTTSTSATFPTLEGRSNINVAANVPGAVNIFQASPVVRFSLTGTTTIYLIAFGIFTVSTLQAFGVIRARRVR